MAATYTHKGVEYNRINVPNMYTGGMYSKAKYTVNGVNSISRLPGKFINILDVDFNDAVIDNGSTTISDISDLLIRLGNTYTKEISDNKYQEKGEYLTEHQSLDNYPTRDEVESNYQPRGEYLTEHQSLDSYPTRDEIESNYQPRGEYLTEHQPLDDYITRNEIESNYQPRGEYLTEHQSLDNYITRDEVDATYQPRGEYLTEHQSLEDYITRNDIEVAGYLTEHQSLEGYATEQYVDNKFDTIQIPEIDQELIDTISQKANSDDVYTKQEIDSMIGNVPGDVENQSVMDYVVSENQSIRDDVNGLGEQIESINTIIEDNEETVAIALEALNNKFDNYSTTVESQEYIDNKIADLVNNAPEALDTLKEIADRIETGDSAVEALTGIVSDKANKDDVYTKEEADAKFLALDGEVDLTDYYTKEECDEKFATKEYVDEKFADIYGMISQINNNILLIMSRLDNPEETVDDGYYLYCGNYADGQPDHIDNTNAVLISDIQNDVRIYKENSVDEDIYWYFTLPNVNQYDLYDDSEIINQNELVDVIDSEFLGKYTLYKTAIPNRTISLIAKIK